MPPSPHSTFPPSPHPAANARPQEVLTGLPDGPARFVEQILAIEHSDAWSDANQLWDMLMQVCPDLPDGYAGAARVLRRLGRVDDEDAVLCAMQERFPDDPFPPWRLAWLATERHDLPEAVRRWAHARTRFPDRLDCWLIPGRFLRLLGRHDEA